MKGILLVNLGSPDSTSEVDVRRYLREFLSDKYVIDTSWLMRKFLVECIILPRRPKQSAQAYNAIWTDKGSPLVTTTQGFSEKLALQTRYKVAYAMRYGQSSIKTGIQQLHEQGVKEILLVPLYPQYAMSTVKTVVEKAKQVIRNHFKDVKLNVLPIWYNKVDYIALLAASIEKQWIDKEIDHLLFSYHGVPHSHITKTDPTREHCTIDGSCCHKSEDSKGQEAQKLCYRHQCMETTRLVVERLRLNEDQYSLSFQSRLGNQPWLEPATADVLIQLPAQGKRRVAVVCPAFVSDCLETLEEIAQEGKKHFLESGGTSFTYLECLNDDDQWVDLMKQWCETYFA